MAKKASAQSIVNIGGGIAATLLVAYLVISYRYFDDTPVGCMAAYTNAAKFDLQNSQGLPMSMIELQARAGTGEQGLMHNASIVNLSEGPAAAALEVKLGRADPNDSTSPIGIHFAWRPLGIAGATHACLRYSVLLPEDFDFSLGGTLPGIFGGTMPDRVEPAGEKSFALRTHWFRNGASQFRVQSKSVNDNGTLSIGREGAVKLARGRWMTIDEEVVLNSAGAADGVVRIWVDGKKVAENKKLKLREDERTGIDGVVATVGFSGNARDISSSANGSLRLSPIEFGWR